MSGVTSHRPRRFLAGVGQLGGTPATIESRGYRPVAGFLRGSKAHSGRADGPRIGPHRVVLAELRRRDDRNLALFAEEIFADGSGKAYWPSADGRLLLYATFDDTAVQTLDYPWIEEYPGDGDGGEGDGEGGGGGGGVEPGRLKLTPTRSVRYPTVRS